MGEFKDQLLKRGALSLLKKIPKRYILDATPKPTIKGTIRGKPADNLVDQILKRQIDDQTEAIRKANIATEVKQAEYDARVLKGEKRKTAWGKVRKMRSIQGTPVERVGQNVRELAQKSSDPEMRGRAVKVLYDKAPGKKKHDANAYWPGEKRYKPESSRIKQEQGIKATIEQHHIIHNYDSSAIGALVRQWDDPEAYNDFYTWMFKEFKILSGDYDLNIANLPTGPHRLKGGLHTWLERLGFEDYWDDLADQFPQGLNPDELKQAFRTYVDQVLDPSMLKMKNLVETSPDKGKYAWEGAYIPQYLVNDAKKRIKHLQQVNKPARLRGGEGGIDEAIEGQIEQAYKSGEGRQGSRYQEILEVEGERILVESRKGFGSGPDVPLKRAKKER